jgi:hypothetical protein
VTVAYVGRVAEAGLADIELGVEAAAAAVAGTLASY